MYTFTSRLLLTMFTVLWLSVISELLNNAYPMYLVIAGVLLYGIFIAYALEIDERYDDE